MTPPETRSNATPIFEPTLESLQEGYQSLRALFQFALVALILMSGSLNIFLFRQVSLVRVQVAEMSQSIADYEKNKAPVMNAFLSKLQTFAKTNPDFAPILEKYLRAPTTPQSLGAPTSQSP